MFLVYYNGLDDVELHSWKSARRLHAGVVRRKPGIPEYDDAVETRRRARHCSFWRECSVHSVLYAKSPCALRYAIPDGTAFYRINRKHAATRRISVDLRTGKINGM